jgi:hypothetical protein
VAVGLIIALGACSSGDDDDAGDTTVVEDGAEDGSEDATGSEEATDADAPASVEACGVVSLADVTAAGVPAASGPTQNEANPNFDQCGFFDESGAEVLSVSVFPPLQGEGLIGDQEPIEGIGAEAVYSEGLQVINVTLEDGTFVSLYLLDASLDVRTILIDLAGTAFG